MNMGISSLFDNTAKLISQGTPTCYKHWRSRNYDIEKVLVQLDMDEVMYSNAVDETCTVSTTSLMNPDAECKEQYLYE